MMMKTLEDKTNFVWTFPKGKVKIIIIIIIMIVVTNFQHNCKKAN